MKGKNKNIVFNCLILLGVVAILISAYFIYAILTEYRTGNESYKHLTEFVRISETTEPKPISGNDDTNIQWPSIDFSALQERNRDMVAWLYCEGTPLNYPVVQGGDNEYYLTHLFNGEENKAGCLFMDVNNSPPGFLDENTLIYGHNMKNGSMFASITKYKNQEYYEDHPRILLLTPKGNYTIELFAGYTANINDNSWYLAFESKEEYGEWLKESRNKSSFQSDVPVTDTDRVVTLSTCSYEFDNARYVIVGKLVAWDH